MADLTSRHLYYCTEMEQLALVVFPTTGVETHILTVAVDIDQRELTTTQELAVVEQEVMGVMHLHDTI